MTTWSGGGALGTCKIAWWLSVLVYKLSVTEFLAGQLMTQTERSPSHKKYSDLPQLATELQMDSDGTMQPQAHSKVFYLVTVGSSSTLPRNIHSMEHTKPLETNIFMTCKTLPKFITILSHGILEPYSM